MSDESESDFDFSSVDGRPTRLASTVMPDHGKEADAPKARLAVPEREISSSSSSNDFSSVASVNALDGIGTHDDVAPVPLPAPDAGKDAETDGSLNSHSEQLLDVEEDDEYFMSLTPDTYRIYVRQTLLRVKEFDAKEAIQLAATPRPARIIRVRFSESVQVIRPPVIVADDGLLSGHWKSFLWVLVACTIIHVVVALVALAVEMSHASCVVELRTWVYVNTASALVSAAVAGIRVFYGGPSVSYERGQRQSQVLVAHIVTLAFAAFWNVLGIVWVQNRTCDAGSQNPYKPILVCAVLLLLTCWGSWVPQGSATLKECSDDSKV